MEGIIVKNISNDYLVKSNGRDFLCRPRGKFRDMKLIPLVGDKVIFDEEKKCLMEIKERKNKLIRPCVANVDQAVIVSSVKNPDFDTNLLDKMLTIISYNKIEPVICFTKLDLLSDREKEKINKYAVEHIDTELGENVCTVDLVLEPEDICERQADELYLLEPYGTGNPSPLFVLCDADVAEINGIGYNKHCRIILKKDEKCFAAVYFGHSPESLEFSVGDRVDAVFSLEINEYRKHRNVQLNLKCVLAPIEYTDKLSRDETRYREIINGARYSIEDDIYPTRSEFALLYTYIKRKTCGKSADFSLRELISECSVKGDNPGIKLRFMLDIFEEMKLLEIVRHDGDYDIEYNITVKFVRGKVNLDKSLILKSLRSKQEKV